MLDDGALDELVAAVGGQRARAMFVWAGLACLGVAAFVMWCLVQPPDERLAREVCGHHGCHWRRAQGDPKNAWIRGCVRQRGIPVVDELVFATAQTCGYYCLNDRATTDEHGCYEIELTSDAFTRQQIILLHVVGKLAGGTRVELGPGQVVEHADIEVGPHAVINAGP